MNGSCLSASLHSLSSLLATPSPQPPPPSNLSLSFHSLESALVLSYHSPYSLKLKSIREGLDLLLSLQGLQRLDKEEEQRACEWVDGLRAALKVIGAFKEQKNELKVTLKMPNTYNAHASTSTFIASNPASIPRHFFFPTQTQGILFFSSLVPNARNGNIRLHIVSRHISISPFLSLSLKLASQTTSLPFEINDDVSFAEEDSWNWMPGTLHRNIVPPRDKPLDYPLPPAPAPISASSSNLPPPNPTQPSTLP
ncbi:hypothetical protein P7C70_g1083, partial [Phenoliferia sp. Uapishka_3]